MHEEVIGFDVPVARDISVASGQALDFEAWIFLAGVEETGVQQVHSSRSRIC